MKKFLTIIFVIVALQMSVTSIASADGGSGNSYYRVRSGDTLYSIGRQYGVSAYRIADANGLSNPNHIYAGQVLYIPSGGYGDCYNWDCRDGGNNTIHRVRYGETLYSIGRQYNVHPNHIAEVNNLYNPNYIYVGQRLRIPSGSSYPWGGCGGYNYGCDRYGSGYNHNSGYNYGCNDYNSGCDGYNYGCDGYNSGCNGNNYGCDGYNSGCSGYNYGCGGSGSGCSNYGYDYTGYYYNRGNQRYSFTCGQNFNCW